MQIRAGVRVPQPYGCFDGVLLMELVTDDAGDVAPRLGDVGMTEEQAEEDHRDLHALARVRPPPCNTAALALRSGSRSSPWQRRRRAA